MCVFLLPSKCMRSRLSNFLCAFDLACAMRTYALALRCVLAFAGAELKCVHAIIKPAYEHCFIALLFNVCLATKVAAALALAGLFRLPPFVDRACTANTSAQMLLARRPGQSNQRLYKRGAPISRDALRNGPSPMGPSRAAILRPCAFAW